MAIEWIEEIPRIRRILAEAETSSRLVAIRSLELIMNQEALNLLEEYHASAISFEKFFMEKAMNNIRSFLQTGEVPPELEKARERSQKLREAMEDMNLSSSYEDVELDDVAMSLKKEPASVEEPAYHDSPQEVLETEDTSALALEPEVESVDEIVPEQENLGQDYSELESMDYGSEAMDLVQEPVEPAVELSLDGVGGGPVIEEVSVAPEAEMEPQGLEYEQSPQPPEDHSSYDDLLPPLTPESDPLGAESDLLEESPQEPAEEEEAGSSGFEDLLPENHTMSQDLSDSPSDYDDLLPSLDGGGAGEGYDDLLPPLQEGGGDYDDLLPAMSDSGSFDAYDDLLPPMQADAQDVSDYDDLLPPIQESSNESSGYDDLLPPLQNSTEGGGYDDLLPPMRSDEGELPQNEGGHMDLDDLLPPMKPGGS